MKKAFLSLAGTATCFWVLAATVAAAEPAIVTTRFYLLPWRQAMADRVEMLQYQLLAARQQPFCQQQVYLYLVPPLQGQVVPQQLPQTIPYMQIFEQPPQTLPIQGEPRQLLPVPGLPKQPLPIQGEPKQQLPIQGAPPQTLPLEGTPKQELPGSAPKQQLSPQQPSQPQTLPSAPSPSGYQRYTRGTVLIRALYRPTN
jgi:hypothetical protein